MTFADASARLARKKNKYEALLKSPSLSMRNAAKRMYDRVSAAEEKLFLAQESLKKESGMGSALPKFWGGGDTRLGLARRNDLLEPIQGRPGTIAVDTTAAAADPYVSGTRVPYDYSEPAVNPYAGWQRQNNIGLGISAATSGISGMLGSYAMGRMQSPAAPALLPRVWLNKTLDTGATRNDIARANMTAQRQAEGLTDRQVTTALKQKAGVNTINQLGRVAEAENNFRTEVGNREAMMNNQVGAQNVWMLNQHAQDKINFHNNKINAGLAYANDALGKAMSGYQDYIGGKNDMMQWNAMKGMWEPAVQADMDASIQSIYPWQPKLPKEPKQKTPKKKRNG